MSTLFLCGDVMVGRGIDQLFTERSRTELREAWLSDARDYVLLAEERHGAIGRPVEHAYVWGDALEALERFKPDVRLINLETSITTSDDFWPEKSIHYRLHPANLGVLTAAKIDACTLANNHVLDFGRHGLSETLDSLSTAGLRAAGAGRTREEARRPARVGAFVIASAGTDSSGIPEDWQAQPTRSGVYLLESLSDQTATELAERLLSERQPGERTVASLHWGTNWGYDVPEAQVRFAHRLIELGVDLVHGHSSHHPRGLELYRDKLILYGCGDFISDYEGIHGHERYRPDLRLMYLPTLNGSGELESLRVIPFQSHRLQLRSAAPADAAWLAQTLTTASRPFNTALRVLDDGTLGAERA